MYEDDFDEVSGILDANETPLETGEFFEGDTAIDAGKDEEKDGVPISEDEDMNLYAYFQVADNGAPWDRYDDQESDDHSNNARGGHGPAVAKRRKKVKKVVTSVLASIDRGDPNRARAAGVEPPYLRGNPPGGAAVGGINANYYQLSAGNRALNNAYGYNVTKQVLGAPAVHVNAIPPIGGAVVVSGSGRPNVIGESKHDIAMLQKQLTAMAQKLRESNQVRNELMRKLDSSRIEAEFNRLRTVIGNQTAAISLLDSENKSLRNVARHQGKLLTEIETSPGGDVAGIEVFKSMDGQHKTLVARIERLTTLLRRSREQQEALTEDCDKRKRTNIRLRRKVKKLEEIIAEMKVPISNLLNGLGSPNIRDALKRLRGGGGGGGGGGGALVDGDETEGDGEVDEGGDDTLDEAEAEEEGDRTVDHTARTIEKGRGGEQDRSEGEDGYYEDGFEDDYDLTAADGAGGSGRKAKAVGVHRGDNKADSKGGRRGAGAKEDGSDHDEEEGTGGEKSDYSSSAVGRRGQQKKSSAKSSPKRTDPNRNTSSNNRGEDASVSAMESDSKGRSTTAADDNHDNISHIEGYLSEAFGIPRSEVRRPVSRHRDDADPSLQQQRRGGERGGGGGVKGVSEGERGEGDGDYYSEPAEEEDNHNQDQEQQQTYASYREGKERRQRERSTAVPKDSTSSPVQRPRKQRQSPASGGPDNYTYDDAGVVSSKSMGASPRKSAVPASVLTIGGLTSARHPKGFREEYLYATKMQERFQKVRLQHQKELQALQQALQESNECQEKLREELEARDKDARAHNVTIKDLRMNFERLFENNKHLHRASLLFYNHQKLRNIPSPDTPTEPVTHMAVGVQTDPIAPRLYGGGENEGDSPRILVPFYTQMALRGIKAFPGESGASPHGDLADDTVYGGGGGGGGGGHAASDDGHQYHQQQHRSNGSSVRWKDDDIQPAEPHSPRAQSMVRRSSTSFKGAAADFVAAAVRKQSAIAKRSPGPPAAKRGSLLKLVAPEEAAGLCASYFTDTHAFSPVDGVGGSSSAATVSSNTATAIAASNGNNKAAAAANQGVVPKVPTSAKPSSSSSNPRVTKVKGVAVVAATLPAVPSILSMASSGSTTPTPTASKSKSKSVVAKGRSPRTRTKPKKGTATATATAASSQDNDDVVPPATSNLLASAVASLAASSITVSRGIALPGSINGSDNGEGDDGNGGLYDKAWEEEDDD